MVRLGHRFAWRSRGPLVLVVCGVSGSGKTTVARQVAELSGWAHLSSDVTRKRLAGLAPTERGGAELYSRERTIETYRELGHDGGRANSSAIGGVDRRRHLSPPRGARAFRAGLGDPSAADAVRRVPRRHEHARSRGSASASCSPIASRTPMRRWSSASWPSSSRSTRSPSAGGRSCRPRLDPAELVADVEAIVDVALLTASADR